MSTIAQPNITDAMAPVVGRVRAYFAPVDRVAKSPTLFDPAQNGAFDLNNPPSPWLDLGWIAGFTRKSATKIDALSAGAPSFAQLQARASIDATVSFAFESWGKLQISLAAGTQQLNLLKPAPGVPFAGSGGTAVAATPLAAGSTATLLQLGTSTTNFSVGELVAVDVDYDGTTGFVGSGVSGAYIKTALTDIDYIRRITLNVARISAINTTTGAVTLSSPLLAGAPAAGMKVSQVFGFCDREGSTFFQEWSALFVAQGQQGERVLFHYPRLQAAHGIAESTSAAPANYETLRTTASFRALPVKDAVDGETVVCFRSYIPA